MLTIIITHSLTKENDRTTQIKKTKRQIDKWNILKLKFIGGKDFDLDSHD